MDKSIMCATCARYQYGFNYCTCPVFNAQPTPRPATAEPPAWKGENLATGLLAYEYDPVAGELKEIRADEFYVPPRKVENNLPCKFCGTMVHASQWCACDAQQAALKKWDALYEKKKSPEPSPLDRALERKAREFDWSGDGDELVVNIDPEQVKGWVGTPGLIVSDLTMEIDGELVRPEHPAISRAMLTPITFTARLGVKT